MLGECIAWRVVTTPSRPSYLMEQLSLAAPNAGLDLKSSSIQAGSPLFKRVLTAAS